MWLEPISADINALIDKDYITYASANDPNAGLIEPSRAPSSDCDTASSFPMIESTQSAVLFTIGATLGIQILIAVIVAVIYYVTVNKGDKKMNSSRRNNPK
jgi:hypothetical protein